MCVYRRPERANPCSKFAGACPTGQREPQGREETVDHFSFGCRPCRFGLHDLRLEIVKHKKTVNFPACTSTARAATKMACETHVFAHSASQALFPFCRCLGRTSLRRRRRIWITTQADNQRTQARNLGGSLAVISWSATLDTWSSSRRDSGSLVLHKSSSSHDVPGRGRFPSLWVVHLRGQTTWLQEMYFVDKQTRDAHAQVFGTGQCQKRGGSPPPLFCSQTVTFVVTHGRGGGRPLVHICNHCRAE